MPSHDGCSLHGYLPDTEEIMADVIIPCARRFQFYINGWKGEGSYIIPYDGYSSLRLNKLGCTRRQEHQTKCGWRRSGNHSSTFGTDVNASHPPNACAMYGLYL